MQPLIIGGLGATELLIVLAVVILLFGATKLPELARGSGRALRIFKAETHGLMDDDQDSGPVGRPQPVAQPVTQPVAQPVDRAMAPPVSEPVSQPVVETVVEPRQR